MALDELEKRLNQEGEDFSARNTSNSFHPEKGDVPSAWKDEPSKTNDATVIMPNKPKRSKSFFYIIGTVIAVLVVVIIVLAYLLFGRPGFDAAANLMLKIDAPESVASGEAVTWTVTYENRNSVALESVDVIFVFPPDTLPATGDVNRPIQRERRSLGRIEAGAVGEEVFRGVIFGEEEEVLGAEAIIEFRPEGSSVRLASESENTVMITRSQLTVDFDFPDEVQREQEVEVRVKVRSTADQTFEDVALGVTYPFGFTFDRAEPEPDEDNNIWYINTLESGEDEEIIIYGTVGEESSEAQTFEARLGNYDSVRRAWTIFALGKKELFIRAPFLSVSTRVENLAGDAVNPGDIVDVTIFWKNNLPVAVENAFIETVIVGDAIDLRGFQSLAGSLDDSTRTVRWASGFVPELAIVDPGEEGRFSFRVRIKDPLPLTGSSDREFSAQFETRMSTNNVPQGFEGVRISGSAESAVKIATVVDFKQQGFYFDGRIANFGPLPPRAGEETTYTIVWALLNRTNEVRDGQVRASLPAYVTWKGVVDPTNSAISYNENSREIVWDVPLLPVGTGYTRAPLEVAFQVGVRPSISHVGTSPQIISEATATGRDTFTDQLITERSSAVTTAVRDDGQVSNEQERVVE